jgi:(p)ppGpp synthase/HD superfamily hydrolase
LRGNGEPFLAHADAVARIVEQEIGLTRDAVITVYLHEASRKSPEMMEEIHHTFGADIKPYGHWSEPYFYHQAP